MLKNCLSKTEFILYIAQAIDEASNHELDWSDSLRQAIDIYEEFVKDENIEFGNEEFDWSPEAAKELAFEYSISYWDS